VSGDIHVTETEVDYFENLDEKEVLAERIVDE
jgi:hypothetical protein